LDESLLIVTAAMEPLTGPWLLYAHARLVNSGIGVSVGMLYR
jgi:hypothetical protein